MTHPLQIIIDENTSDDDIILVMQNGLKQTANSADRAYRKMAFQEYGKRKQPQKAEPTNAASQNQVDERAIQEAQLEPQEEATQTPQIESKGSSAPRLFLAFITVIIILLAALYYFYG